MSVRSAENSDKKTILEFCHNTFSWGDENPFWLWQNMVDENKNAESFKTALDTLNQVASNPSTPKTVRKTISDLINEFTTEKYSVSVRAANAISLLDDITQDPNLPSYVRVTLWQVVSTLENIRE